MFKINNCIDCKTAHDEPQRSYSSCSGEEFEQPRVAAKWPIPSSRYESTIKGPRVDMTGLQRRITPLDTNNDSKRRHNLVRGFLVLSLCAFYYANVNKYNNFVMMMMMMSPEEQPQPANDSSNNETTAATTPSHMLSLKPLTKSLHPKWKLWDEMNSEEQDEGLAATNAYLTKYGKIIMPKPNFKQKITHGKCDLLNFASGHFLCGPPPKDKCVFFSFGINDDPSLDKNNWVKNGIVVVSPAIRPSLIPLDSRTRSHSTTLERPCWQTTRSGRSTRVPRKSGG